MPRFVLLPKRGNIIIILNNLFLRVRIELHNHCSYLLSLIFLYFITDNVHSIKDILEKLNAAALNHEVSDWESGGQALYHYMHICDEVSVNNILNNIIFIFFYLYAVSRIQQSRTSLVLRHPIPHFLSICEGVSIGGTQRRSVGFFCHFKTNLL